MKLKYFNDQFYYAGVYWNFHPNGDLNATWIAEKIHNTEYYDVVYYETDEEPYPLIHTYTFVDQAPYNLRKEVR